MTEPTKAALGSTQGSNTRDPIAAARAVDQLDAQRAIEPGLRYDAAKLRYDLIPPEAIEAYVSILTVGATKYSDRNWEKGMSWSRCFASLMRHAWAWARGEDLDPETKLPHMAHVAWNALALVTYASRKIGTDDRPTGNK